MNLRSIWEQLAPARLVGYALYNAWLLTTFYDTVVFCSASNQRDALYLNQMASLAVLAATLLLLPLAVPHADKWVLSRRLTLGGGIGLAVFTLLLAFADPAIPLGLTLVLLSALGTGVASGSLFLGWTRLYSDVGTRVSLCEFGVAWLLAGLLSLVFSAIPALVAVTAVSVSALASGILLRAAAFKRPRRPRPSRSHRLQRHTTRMFVRGLCACAGMGLVEGFTDVLGGFELITVPEGYAAMLSTVSIVVAAFILAIILTSENSFATFAHRLVTLLLAAGCLLTPFAQTNGPLCSILVFGAYLGFTMLLCVVCIDISNYFDQPSTRTFGLAFFTLYTGELLGTVLGQVVTRLFRDGLPDLQVIAFVLTLAVLVANLFLFTEKDLTETSLGEMTDSEPERGLHAQARATGAWNEEPADALTTASVPVMDQEQRMARIAALFARRYGLTPRETEILPFILRGRTIARIQEELHISQGTVGTHIRHTYQKVGVSNRQALLDLVDELSEADLLEADAEQ